MFSVAQRCLNFPVRDSGAWSLADSKEIRIAVLGTPEHEGRMCGRAFKILGVDPIYIHPSHPVLRKNPAPAVILLSREWSVDVRHAAIEARRHGIPVVYIMDGIIEWAYLWQNWGFVKPEGTVLQPLIASDLCVIGQHPARILAGLGLADKIHIVGLPRLDGIKRQRVIDQDQPRRIVVATAKTFGHNTAHKVYVRAALRDLKDWFNSHPELTPVWRINEELAAELAVVPSMGGAMVEMLQSASGVVSFTSTVLLEAMLIGIPTAQIDYRTVPQYVQTAWEIRCAEQIDGVIQELLFAPPERLALQEANLRDELELGDASARLAAVIRNAVDKNALEAAAEARHGPVVGRIDFRQIHTHLSAFAVSPMARLQYELDATYQLWERERERVQHAENKLASLRGEISIMFEDRWIKLLRMLAGFPGFRKTGRILSRLIALD